MQNGSAVVRTSLTDCDELTPRCSGTSRNPTSVKRCDGVWKKLAVFTDSVMSTAALNIHSQCRNAGYLRRG